MRHLFYFLITLPLMAQAPATDAPAGGQAPKPEAQQPAAASAASSAQAQAQPAAPSAEAWITGSVDVGWRFITGVGGNLDTYRSVVNLGEGPKLFGANATIQPTNTRYVDRIDINASSWGGEPYNTARIDARKLNWYDFTFDYRNIAYFNFLPSYANPGAINPALPFLDQNGFDIFRRNFNTELDLFPGRRIIPYVAYSRNGVRGTGTTDFVFESNEYVVPTLYNNHTNEARGGVRLQYNRWGLTLEGGSFNFRDDQQVGSGTQLPNLGNNRNPFLGEQLFLSGGQQQYGVRGSAAFTRAIFTANPVSWADVSAQFLYSQPKTDIHFTQNNTGNFFSSDLPGFYTAQLLDASGTVKQPHPAGAVNVTLRPFRRLRILESWMTDQLHSAGSALLVDQLLATGQPLTPQNAVAAERFVANYSQEEVDLLFDVTSLFTVRGGYRYVWGNTIVPASLIIESLGFTTEQGQLRRNVALAGVSFRTPVQFRLNIDLEASPGDRAYFRTSLNDYVQARVLARWQVLSTLLLTGRFSVLSNQNPNPLIRYDFQSRDTTFSVNWNPTSWKAFGVLAEYSRSTVRSNITYVVPSDFTSALSVYRENANIGTLLADIPFTHGTNAPKVSFGGSFYRSAGTAPTRYWQPLARVAIPIGPHVQFNTEWRYYGLTQPFFLYEGFRSNQFTTALRFSM